MPAPGPVPDHGTTARYRLRRDPCRCARCRKAWARKMAEYRWEFKIRHRQFHQLALPVG